MKRVARAVVTFVLTAVVAAIAAALVLGLFYDSDARIPDGFAGTVTEVGGVRLRVLQEGTGRDLLMIHGSPGMLEDHEPQAAALRDRFRVTRYDRPGHGFSADGGQYSVEYNARIAMALIDQLGLERTVVVGHSYGGTIALAMAGMASPRVRSVVVLDSALYASVRAVNPAYRVLRFDTFGPGIARLLPSSVAERRVSEGIAGEFKAGPPPDGFVATRTRVFSQPKVVHAIANEHWEYTAELGRLHPHYREITIPVFIVAQRDDAVRKSNAEQFKADLPRAELLLLSPTGHYVQIEQAEAVTSVIKQAADE